MNFRSARLASSIAWLLCGLFFGTLLSSIRDIPHTRTAACGLLLLSLVAIVRPALAAGVLAALAPVVSLVAGMYWNPGVGWPAALVCAGLTGLAVHAAFTWRGGAVPPALAAPALVLGAIVTAAMVVSIGVQRLRLGPAFGEIFVRQITSQHFVDPGFFPAFQTGMPLIEGLLLFALTARLAANDPRVLRWISAAVVTGALMATALTARQLCSAGLRHGTWSTVLELARTLRWNAAFGDVNAAGSFYLMAILVAAGLAAAHTGVARAVYAAATGFIAAAFWLSGSRVAYLAAAVTLGLGAVVWVVRQQPMKRAAVRVSLVSGACAVMLVVALVQPARGNQTSSDIAVNIRIGLAKTSVRMIASQPIFGVGLGEFSRRSGEFSSPALLALFPPAAHENAHNNFLQVAAELGPAGGIAFVWLLAAAFRSAFRGTTRGPLALAACVALTGFVLTWLGGHPLLLPETAVPFWILLGAAAGAAATAPATPGRSWSRGYLLGVIVAIAALAATLPSRVSAAERNANLEHVGLGVSSWETRDDTERYRSAVDRAVLFVPTETAFKLRLKPMTDHAVHVELRLDGKVADRRLLRPGEWTTILVPERTVRGRGKFAPLEVQVLDEPAGTTLRITKVEPIGASAS